MPSFKALSVWNCSRNYGRDQQTLPDTPLPAELCGLPASSESHLHRGFSLESCTQSCIRCEVLSTTAAGQLRESISVYIYLSALNLLQLPLLMSFRKLNRSRIRDIVENYMKTTSYAGTINALIFYMICVFRRINGRFVRWCTPPLAAYVAAQVIWLVPSKILLFLNTGVTASVSSTKRLSTHNVDHYFPDRPLRLYYGNWIWAWCTQGPHKR